MLDASRHHKLDKRILPHWSVTSAVSLLRARTLIPARLENMKASEGEVESGAEIRPFRFEREMLGPLIATLPAVLGLDAADSAGELTIIQTPAVGNVIPDLLIGRWRDLPSGQLAAITFVEAAALSFIESVGSSSVTQFSDRFHLSAGAADRTLQKLTSRNFLGVNSEGQYYLEATVSPRSCQLTAVEVKLSRWRDALDQAADYLAFADSAYVVLDGQRFVVRPEVLNEFHSTAVGLLLQYGQVLHMIVAAKPHQAVSADRFVALKHLTKAQRAGSAASLNPVAECTKPY